MKRIPILNGRFDALSLSQTVDAVFDLLKARRRGWLCTVNVAILMTMRQNAQLQKFVDRASLVVADGQPLVWYASLAGTPLPERVAGVDLVDALCERAAAEGKRVYLLGATETIVTEVARRLRATWPGLKVDHADGYFGPAEACSRADRVRSCRADILFVGMGVPRQEAFLEEHWERLGVGIAVGVGGSFDVLAGARRRAPGWLQSIGMEWFCRMIQEPRRLFARYLVTNAQFLWYSLMAALPNGGSKPELETAAEVAPGRTAVLDFDAEDDRPAHGS